MRELEGGTTGIAEFSNQFFKIVSGAEAAFAGTHDNTDIHGIFVRHLEVCILQRTHARNGLELAQVVELAVESHLDAQFLVVFQGNRRTHRSGFRLLAGLHGFHIGGLAVAERRHDSKTRHGNLLACGTLGRHVTRFLRENDSGVGATESNVIAQHTLQIFMACKVLHEVHFAHLFLEGGRLFFAIGEGREHGIGSQSLNAEHGFDSAGSTQAVARKHLGRAHAHRRVFFAKVCLEGSHFGVIVLARTRTVGIDVTDVGLCNAGILDGAVDGFLEAKAIFAGGGNMVCIAGNARTKHFAVLLGRALLGMFVRFNNHDAGAFAQRNAIAAVERRAAVFIKRMQRKESGIRHRGKRVGTTRNDNVCLASANQVAGHRNRNRTGGTSVCHVRHNTAGATSFSHLGGNRCDRHLGNFRSVATMLMILFNGKNTTHATSDHHAHALVITKVLETCIGQGFVCSLDAKFRDAVLFFGSVNFIEGVALDFGSQVRIAIHCINRSCLMNAGNRFQGILPCFFDIVTDGTNDA